MAHGKEILGPVLGLVLFTIGLAIQLAPAQAQQIPGLVVATPPSENAQPQSGGLSGGRPPIFGAGVPRAPAPGTSRPQTRKPKRKAKPRRSASNSRAIRRRSVQRKKHGVAVLVNDEPITHHEIDQRARLLGMNGRNIGKLAASRFKALIRRKSTNSRLRAILKQTIDENRGKPRDAVLAIFERRKKAYAKRLQAQAVSSARASVIPGQRKRAQKELIEERLKLQEAKQLKVRASNAQVDQTISGVAKRNKMSSKQFLGNLKRGGVDPNSFKERVRAQISWIAVVRRRYGQFISVNMADIDRHVAKVASDDAVTLRLHKIILPLPRSLGQGAIATRLQQGEQLQAKFSSCQATKVLAGTMQGAVFKDLGRVKSTDISEPERSLLIQAKDGEMLPPLTRKEGVVLYAVCGRTAATAKAKVRRQLQQREFDVMGRRHLADLKRDAHIEYR